MAESSAYPRLFGSRVADLHLEWMEPWIALGGSGLNKVSSIHDIYNLLIYHISIHILYIYIFQYCHENNITYIYIILLDHIYIYIIIYCILYLDR